MIDFHTIRPRSQRSNHTTVPRTTPHCFFPKKMGKKKNTTTPYLFILTTHLTRNKPGLIAKPNGNSYLVESQNPRQLIIRKCVFLLVFGFSFDNYIDYRICFQNRGRLTEVGICPIQQGLKGIPFRTIARRASCTLVKYK